MNVATIDNPHSGLARQPPPEPKLEAATKERLALARQHRDMLYNIKMGHLRSLARPRSCLVVSITQVSKLRGFEELFEDGVIESMFATPRRAGE